jgi:hypothetical protein
MSKKRNEDEFFYLHDHDFGGDSQSGYTTNSLEMEMKKNDELPPIKKEEKKINKDVKHQIQLVSDFEIIRHKKNEKKEENIKKLNTLYSHFSFENESDCIDAINKLKLKLENDKKNHELEIIKVNKEINEKDELIKSISNINGIMEKSLKKLTSKVEKLNNTENAYLKEKEEPIEIALKVKEKDIKNVQSLANILSKENKNMQNILDNYTNADSKRELSDRLILKEKENNRLKNEIKTLKIFNKDYNEWEKEKEDLKIAIDELQNKLYNSKVENKNEKKEIKKLQEKYYSVHSRNKNNKTNEKDKEKEKDEEENEGYAKSFDFHNIKKEEKKKIIKIRSIKDIANSTYKLINNEQKEKLFEIMGGEENKEKYDELIKKLESLEKYRIAKDKNEIKKIKNQNNEINEIDQQIEYLQRLNDDKTSTIKTLETQIIEYKNYKKSLQKKINSLIKVLEDLKSKKKIKENENNSLKNQMTNLQKIVKENCYGLNNEKNVNEISKIVSSIKENKEDNINKTPKSIKNKKISKLNDRQNIIVKKDVYSPDSN